MVYFDPPYYKKGPDLYINFYKHNDHEQIATTIKNHLGSANWLVSYDNAEPIREFYKQYRQRTFNINYHAGNASKGSEVFIFSDNLWVPNIDSPTDKKKIRHYAQLSVYTMRESGELQRVEH